MYVYDMYTYMAYKHTYIHPYTHTHAETNGQTDKQTNRHAHIENGKPQTLSLKSMLADCSTQIVLEFEELRPDPGTLYPSTPQAGPRDSLSFL